MVSQAKAPLKVQFTVIQKCKMADTIQKRCIMGILPWFVLKSLYTPKVVKELLYTCKWSPKLPGMFHYELLGFFLFTSPSVCSFSLQRVFQRVNGNWVFLSPLILSCGTEISGHIHFWKLRAFALGVLYSIFFFVGILWLALKTVTSIDSVTFNISW